MLIALAAAVVIAQFSATPAAAAPPAKAADAPAPVKVEKPKLVCHDETETGSIISHRVCRTLKQTEAERRQAQRDNDALSDHLAACHGAAC